MKLEIYPHVDQIRGNTELAVPGLEGHHLSCIVIWPEAQSWPSHSLPLLRDLIVDLTALCFVPTLCDGWICTTCSAAAVSAYRAAGWGVTEPDSTTSTQFYLWSRLPLPDTSEWQRFWTVPFDPFFTNVLVLRKGEGFSSPPSQALRRTAKGLSTLLHWPWFESQVAQQQWLGEIEAQIALLLLGVEQCRLGLQLIVPLENVALLRERLLHWDKRGGLKTK